MSDTQIDDLDLQIANLQAQKKELLNKTRQEALTTTPLTNKTKPVNANKPKAPPKYANPANPQQTWAGGKGARPLWVQSHLASGKPLDDLLIK